MRRTSNVPTVYYYSSMHPINESMVEAPPRGFRFHTNAQMGDFTSSGQPGEYGMARKSFKELADQTFWLLRSPRRILILKECELIHTEGGLLPMNDKPWVVGVEHVHSFFGFRDAWQFSPERKGKLLKLLTSRNCRFILAYSHAAAESLKLAFPEHQREVLSRTQVVYPAVSSDRLGSPTGRPSEDGRIRLLFVGNHFFDKGGREVVAAYLKLRRRLDLSLDVYTDVPTHHEALFERYIQGLEPDPNLRIQSLIPRRQLLDVYRAADIFCFPSYMETFGFVVLEAMAAGLPVICSDAFALPELVEDGVNGFVLPVPISSFARGLLRTPQSLEAYRSVVVNAEPFRSVADQLARRISYLAGDESARRRMGKQSILKVTQGEFSVRSRNALLRNIYADACESTRATS